MGIVGPMVTYLLPILIAYTGGRMVYDVRGGVVGAIATMGVIAGTDAPMFIGGAMIMGPLGAWTMKKIDALWDGKIRPGFEMLVNNFSAGIWGALLALGGFYGLSWVVQRFTDAPVRCGVPGQQRSAATDQHFHRAGQGPLPQQRHQPRRAHSTWHPAVAGTGQVHPVPARSQPRAGMGILLAYMFFGRGAAKASAPGAAIIHFLGGIHEIYFPYVLMKPILILAAIGGGMTGIATLAITNSGLVAPAAPGSIIAVLAQTSRDSYVGVILAVILATAVSFLIAAVILRTSKNKGEDDLSAATSRMEAMKGKKSSVSSALTGNNAGAQAGTVLTRPPVQNIVFACDAGMGSSAMGASVLRNKIKAAGFPEVKVTNSAIANLNDSYDVVVTHQDLTERAQPRTASAVHYSVDNFMNSPKYDDIVELVRSSNSEGAAPETGTAAESTAGAQPTTAATSVAAGHGAHVAEPVAAVDGQAAEGKGVLLRESVVLNGTATDRDAAIDEAGKLLLDRGAVDVSYVHAMHEREESVSTYMGSFLAIPHGTNDAKEHINHSAVSIIRYPEGIDWGGKQVKFVVGVAGLNNEHLHILSSIAKIFTSKAQVAQLEEATTVDEVLELFGKVNA